MSYHPFLHSLRRFHAKLVKTLRWCRRSARLNRTDRLKRGSTSTDRWLRAKRCTDQLLGQRMPRSIEACKWISRSLTACKMISYFQRIQRSSFYWSIAALKIISRSIDVGKKMTRSIARCKYMPYRLQGVSRCLDRQQGASLCPIDCKVFVEEPIDLNV
jgi:hypothetical protein